MGPTKVPIPDIFVSFSRTTAVFLSSLWRRFHFDQSTLVYLTYPWINPRTRAIHNSLAKINVTYPRTALPPNYTILEARPKIWALLRRFEYLFKFYFRRPDEWSNPALFERDFVTRSVFQMFRIYNDKTKNLRALAALKVQFKLFFSAKRSWIFAEGALRSS